MVDSLFHGILQTVDHGPVVKMETSNQNYGYQNGTCV